MTIDTKTNQDIQVEQHSLAKSIFLHLIPGLLITLFYLISAPYFINLGFPPVFALCLAVPFVLVPVELGYIYYAAKKVNGNYSLKNIVLNRERLPKWQFFGYSILILSSTILVFVLLQKPLADYLSQHIFFWLPSWFLNGNSFTGTKGILITTWIMIMVFANIIGPIVEELYFRGYLLPRISRYKKWSPAINSVLFSVYHFMSPWDVVTRIIAVLPLSFIVYKKKNIYLGITAHLILNTLSTLSLLAIIIK